MIFFKSMLVNLIKKITEKEAMEVVIININ